MTRSRHTVPALARFGHDIRNTESDHAPARLPTPQRVFTDLGALPVASSARAIGNAGLIVGQRTGSGFLVGVSGITT